jgi:hypothetical protein
MRLVKRLPNSHTRVRPHGASPLHDVNFALSGDLGNEGRRAPRAPISNGVANANAEAWRKSQKFTARCMPVKGRD